jgi:hypothetical protein
MNADTLIILPTRGRPAAALKTLASILKTTQGRVDVVLCQDDDDEQALRIEGKNVTTRISSRKTFTKWLNAAAVEFCTKYPYLGWAADDVRYPKPLWDFGVRMALKNGASIVYGPDGVQNENLPTHPFVNSSLVQALGYLVYPKLIHHYNDNYLKELGTRLGTIRYLKDFPIEHRHHSTGQSPYDKISAENESSYSQDTATFNEILTIIDSDVARVKAYLASRR